MSTVSAAGDERRRELGVFLRSRRERIQPEEVGFAPGQRRRTPGLRREEVALLAGVGVTWYTWLEQGRDINVSAQVLEAIAGTLRLDRQETNHLFTLSGLRVGPASAECTLLPPSIQKTLDAVLPYPAIVVNERYDILAFNEAYCRVVIDLRQIELQERNMLWLMFVSDRWHCYFTDTESTRHHMVAAYRAALANHLTEPSWQELTQSLLARSPEFATLWERYDVAAPSTRIKFLDHPTAGLLTVDPAVLYLTQSTQLRLTVYTPTDATTESKLHQLLNTPALQTT
ncbi:helix-turn-helix domain-containing protein [Kribbella sandramycini]|uniref:Helix-turn-helix domain-containing protein n=1 Tax=Kribbella sandramycini TaxID=60450 RepID=A0A7Y4KWW2_9ACTN|nr:helix-turn-helix transcriptional regulator [Kribbella sandramycini]MBB6567313.1 transcriptional regulator with XRE-family HTH domain [Kribbella sandramycini]NOL40075.1 helix-turn-helix domain-containing protein [Kribbella sandramycini]